MDLSFFVGTIINEGLGSVAVPSDDFGYYGSNQSSVSIHIYHLDSGIELSSSSVHAQGSGPRGDR